MIDNSLLIQTIIDLFKSAFPVALTMVVCACATNFFTSFVFGEKIRL